MEDINKIIGNNLLKLRKNAKLTQLELAEKFNYSDKSISKWENGESLPSIEVLFELAKFYGTTLDGLTSSEDITNNQAEKSKKKKVKKEKPQKEATPKMFSPKIIITLLSVSIVWICATTLFVMLKITLDINYYMCFMWAWPASFILFTIFAAIWGRSKHLIPVLSILLWTVIASLHLQILLVGYNIWPIYLLGVPLQVTILLCGALVKKPKGYWKKIKEEQKLKKQQELENKKESN